jgi:transcriptional regulator with XRE-family HTH domain
MRALSVAAGLSPSHVEQIINLRQSPKGVGLATLQALAAAAQVRLEWLQTGDGDPEALEATPPTPPAKSGLRLSSGEEREDVEYVDAWFFEALQELQGRRRYSGAQGQAAKRFLVWGSNKLDGDPKKMVLGALEAAKELDETGQQMTPEKIFALLVEKNAPPSGPESGAREYDAALEFTKEFIRKESKKALKKFTPKERKPRG